MEVEKVYYPGGFGCLLLGKRDGKGQYKFGWEKVEMHSVMKRDLVTRVNTIWNLHFWSQWLTGTFIVSPYLVTRTIYLRYLQVINDLKKCGYKKDNCKLNYKFLNNLQQEWKQYATLMRQTKNLMDINIDALYNILKQNQGDVNDALRYKKKSIEVTLDPLVLVAEKMNMSKRKEKVVVSLDSKGSGADDFSELKKTTAFLAKAFNRRKFYSKLTNNNLRTSSTSQSANKKQEFIKTDNKKVEKKADEKKRDMRKVKCYNCKKEGHFAIDCKKAKVNDYNYYKIKMLLAKKDSDEQVLLAEDQEWIESSSDSDQEINANMVFMAQIEKVLSESDESSLSAEEPLLRYSALFDNDKQHRKQIVDQEVLFDKMSVQLVELDKHDIKYNGKKGIGFENPRYFEKAKDLRPSLYDEKVIGLWYTLMFLTHSDEALEIEKFKRSRENKIEFAYDYGNLNASYVNEKINFKDDYFQEIINPDFEKIDSPFQQTSSLKSYVPNVILEKIIIDLEDEVVNLLEKEKSNLEIIESLKSKGFELSENAISKTENQSENDCHVVEKECDNMENPKVIAPEMFKLSVSQSVLPISMSKTSCESNNVERETSSAYVCNDVMNVSCNSKRCDLLDDNNFFIFDDESVKISPVSKMPFRKKSCDSMIIVQICLSIIDSACSKHMTSNRALLTNFVEKFLVTVRFGNNDFAVIAGYGDAVIGSMTIKKVYYVE
nr:integrase, catalytic region, zinc finger, CCHC-type, peptidase aspartic, catalytic [Tanacetum cinerariifolium]